MMLEVPLREVVAPVLLLVVARVAPVVVRPAVHLAVPVVVHPVVHRAGRLVVPVADRPEVPAEVLLPVARLPVDPVVDLLRVAAVAVTLESIAARVATWTAGVVVTPTPALVAEWTLDMVPTLEL